MEENLFTEKEFFVKLELARGNLNTIYGILDRKRRLEYLNKAKKIIEEISEKLNL